MGIFCKTHHFAIPFFFEFFVTASVIPVMMCIENKIQIPVFFYLEIAEQVQRWRGSTTAVLFVDGSCEEYRYNYLPARPIERLPEVFLFWMNSSGYYLH